MMKTKALFFGILLGMGMGLGSLLPSRLVSAESFTCIDGYYSFILTVRSEKMRSEGISDITKLGYCQLNDIFTLDDELDDLKDNFRNAASNCDSTTEYEEDYQRILLEMYFVRHLQDGDNINDADADQLDKLKEQKLEALKADMMKNFVEDDPRVDEDTLDDYFEEWATKYDDRIADYKHCEEGPWAELGSTWADFVTTLKELDFSVEIDDGKSAKDILLPDVDVDADKDMTAMGNSIKNAWEYLQSKKDKENAEVTPATSVSDVNNSGVSMTFDQIFEQLNSSKTDFTLEQRSADRLAEYEVLYGAGGSVESTNLQGLVAEMNAILQEMNNKDLPSIAVNSAKVSDKQCN